MCLYIQPPDKIRRFIHIISLQFPLGVRGFPDQCLGSFFRVRIYFAKKFEPKSVYLISCFLLLAVSGIPTIAWQLLELQQSKIPAYDLHFTSLVRISLKIFCIGSYFRVGSDELFYHCCLYCLETHIINCLLCHGSLFNYVILLRTRRMSRFPSMIMIIFFIFIILNK